MNAKFFPLPHTMASKFFATFTVTFFFFFISKIGGLQFSKNLDTELKQLNKPPIKTIKTKYGDIFDCVDIHKQPSLEHPLLQNHTLQVKPSLIPEVLSPQEYAHQEKYTQFELGDGGCPKGFVPIRRIQKEDLKRLRTYLKKNPSVLNPNTVNKPGWHFASILTRKMSVQFRAARGMFNVYNPSVTKDQHSDSLLYVSTGEFGTHNVIQAGWTVFPAVYGDNRVRFHSMWTADNYNKTGCIDMLCKGFIQISSNVTLGLALSPVSEYGSLQWDLPVAISQDQFSGNWWLIAFQNVMVGYWPKELFTDLASHAKEIGWGGRVHNHVLTKSPPMGSGHMPDEGLGKSCYVEQLQYVASQQGVYEDLNAATLKNHVDNTRCYNLKLFMDYFGRANILFGGPGGICYYAGEV